MPVEEEIPPIQRFILFDKSLLANLDESSSLSELSQHILYYRDYPYPPSPPTELKHHGGDQAEIARGELTCSYAFEKAIQFSSLCLTLLALPRELQCTPTSTEQNESECNPESGGCVYLNTCTLAILPLEQSKTNGIVAVAQLSRLSRHRDVGEEEGTVLRGKLGMRQSAEVVVRRIHALFELFYGGGIAYRLSSLFNNMNMGVAATTGDNSNMSSVYDSQEFAALKMDLRHHYDAFLHHCFIKGSNGDVSLAEPYTRTCNRPSLPCISLQCQTRMNEIDPLDLPKQRQLECLFSADIYDQCPSRLIETSCIIGISSFFKGRYIHTKRLRQDTSDTTPLLDTEQVLALYEYFTLCTHSYETQEEMMPPSDREAYYFIPPPSKNFHPTMSHIVGTSNCHEYEWDGLIRTVYAPKIFLHAFDRYIQPNMQSVYTVMFVRGDLKFILYLEMSGGAEVNSAIEQGDQEGMMSIESRRKRFYSIEQNFGECLSCLHGFMSTIL